MTHVPSLAAAKAIHKHLDKRLAELFIPPPNERWLEVQRSELNEILERDKCLRRAVSPWREKAVRKILALYDLYAEADLPEGLLVGMPELVIRAYRAAATDAKGLKPSYRELVAAGHIWPINTEAAAIFFRFRRATLAPTDQGTSETARRWSLTCGELAVIYAKVFPERALRHYRPGRFPSCTLDTAKRDIESLLRLKARKQWHAVDPVHPRGSKLELIWQ